MSSCEKCWIDSAREEAATHHDRIEIYNRMIKERSCTPEEQAGPEAKYCTRCGKMTVHQYSGECMNCHKRNK